MSVARVADVATVVSIKSKDDGLRCTVERFARIMVRAQCAMPLQPFVETRNEFGKVTQFILRMIGDLCNTPAKKQASKAADCCFAHIMKPTEGSDLHNVLHGQCLSDQIAIDEVMAAATLETSVLEIGKLGKFTRNAPLSSNSPVSNVAIAFASKSTASSSEARQSLAHDRFATNATDTDVPDEPPTVTNTVDYESELAKLRRELSMVRRQLRALQPNHSNDTGEGLMYADRQALHKDDMAAVIDRGNEHDEQIARLTSETPAILERLHRLEDIAHDKNLANQPTQQTRRRRGKDPIQRLEKK
jgi:hypothetical protein